MHVKIITDINRNQLPGFGGSLGAEESIGGFLVVVTSYERKEIFKILNSLKQKFYNFLKNLFDK